jgi:hypothetical protein
MRGLRREVADVVGLWNAAVDVVILVLVLDDVAQKIKFSGLDRYDAVCMQVTEDLGLC